jgi:hypothetical protein
MKSQGFIPGSTFASALLNSNKLNKRCVRPFAAVVAGAVCLVLTAVPAARAQAGYGYGYGDGGQTAPAYGAQPVYPEQAPAQQYEQGDYSGATQAPLNADQLEQLVAPIALYPDGLVAQILTAATYPAQVGAADQWLHQMQGQGYASAEQIEAGANAQSWDPSIKALTAFPQVLDMLNQNLQWTTQLGNAYYNQPQDVMQTVQVMRERAQAAGTLESTPQETVSDYDGSIEIAPPNPEYVYVPVYDPWAVYGSPLLPYPGFSLFGAWGRFWGAGLRFPFGFALSAFMNVPWGWGGWGLDWGSHAVLFGRSSYFTRSSSVRDWGFPHGGPRAYSGYQGGSRMAGSRNYGGAERGGGAVNGGHGWSGSPQPYRGGNAGQEANFGQGRGSVQGPGTNGSTLMPARPGQEEYGFNRGNLTAGRSFAQPSMPMRQEYNRVTPQMALPQASRPQAFAYNRPGNSYGFGTQPGRIASQPGGSFGSFRAPQPMTQRSFAAPPSRSFNAPSPRSGGFSGFGGGGQPRGYSGSFNGSAPKGFSGGGGRSFGSGGGSAPKMSGGGGRSSGGKRR